MNKIFIFSIALFFLGTNLTLRAADGCGTNGGHACSLQNGEVGFCKVGENGKMSCHPYE